MGAGYELDAYVGNLARLVLQCAIRPFDSLVKATGGEMGRRCGSRGQEGKRVKWAQAPRPIAGFDRRLGLAAQCVYLAPDGPGACSIGIEGQSAVDEGFRHCGIASEDEQRVGGTPHRIGIASRRFECLPRQPDAIGDLILQLENVVERAVEAVGPDVRAGRCVDQLPGDAHPVAGFAHAAFEDEAHAKLLRHLFHADRPALVGEGRIAGDHKKSR
jgi:hypothetical protein